MKRPSVDTTSDSDMGETIDVGSENNYSGRNNGSLIRCGSPTTMSPVMARKKRRGIIEKRRRDRINNSLTELRRLVPTAFEKQGSAKLEKAEILQMTVDHLKMLQATGGKDSSIRAPSTGCIAPCSPALSTSLLSLSAKVQAAAAAAQTFPLSFPGGFPIFHPSISASSLTMTAASPPPSYSSPGTSTSQGSSSSRKPYRPWGTEVGAF